MACDGAAAATQAFVTVAGGPLRTDTCTNVQTRREWRTLSDSERRAYIAAVETIRKQPSVLGHSSRYDDIVGFHAEALALIHTSGTLVEKDKQGTQFLVWHRAYLRLYEEALQSVDPSVTLPYWEWSSDAQ
ncbi:Di-copper centre-containing protein, partial [Caulochytrium protostelioides]